MHKFSSKQDKRFNYTLHNDPPKEPKEDNENYDTLKQSMMLKKKLKGEQLNYKGFMAIKSSTVDIIKGAISNSQIAKVIRGKSSY